MKLTEIIKRAKTIPNYLECIICSNEIKNERGCDGNCKVNEEELAGAQKLLDYLWEEMKKKEAR